MIVLLEHFYMMPYLTKFWSTMRNRLKNPKRFKIILRKIFGNSAMTKPVLTKPSIIWSNWGFLTRKRNFLERSILPLTQVSDSGKAMEMVL